MILEGRKPSYLKEGPKYIYIYIFIYFILKIYLLIFFFRKESWDLKKNLISYILLKKLYVSIKKK